MNLGTRSLLFGVHQFAWHPVTVWIAWCRLYKRRPDWRTTICIVIHDWGYWGCRTMDGEDGEQHPRYGAALAWKWFGPKYRDLVLYHSRTFSKNAGKPESDLCWADKTCMLYDPWWFYSIRARLSGELREYRDRAAAREFLPIGAPDVVWFKKLRAHLEVIARQHTAR